MTSNKALISVDEGTWAYKFSLLSPWFSTILSQIKKDCKAEHLSLDPHFVRLHFGGRPIPRISLDEMRVVYAQQIFAGHERLAEFIANRWLFRNMNVYRFFEAKLNEVLPNFDAVEEIADEVMSPILAASIKEFGVETTFCFVILNHVSLSKKLSESLQRDAIQAAAETGQEMASQDPEERIIQSLKGEIKLLKERYEKKIEELRRKHAAEIKKLQHALAMAQQKKSDA